MRRPITVKDSHLLCSRARARAPPTNEGNKAPGRALLTRVSAAPQLQRTPRYTRVSLRGRYVSLRLSLSRISLSLSPRPACPSDVTPARFRRSNRIVSRTRDRDRVNYTFYDTRGVPRLSVLRNALPPRRGLFKLSRARASFRSLRRRNLYRPQNISIFFKLVVSRYFVHKHTIYSPSNNFSIFFFKQYLYLHASFVHVINPLIYKRVRLVVRISGQIK